MDSFVPLRAVCANPGCLKTTLGVDCHRCRLVRYCSNNCMGNDKPVHQPLCESQQNRKRSFYVVEEDYKRLTPDQGNPYPHCKVKRPEPGNEPRLFSKHKVKSLISPQDQDRTEDGDEINISIKGKSVQKALKGCISNEVSQN